LQGLTPGTKAGLSAYGDEENALGFVVGDGKVVLWRREKGKQQTLATRDAPSAPLIELRMTVKDGDHFRFAMGGDGRNWTEVGDQLNGEYLPPWDRAVRVALTVGGARGASARFEAFRILSPTAPRVDFRR
jgi:hypothetical protein